MLYSFSISQGVGIFITQPLLLILMIYILGKIKDIKEKCFGTIGSKNSFYELNNPMKHKHSTILSNSFGWLIFTHIPAKVSTNMFSKKSKNKIKLPVDLITSSNSAVSLFIKNGNTIKNDYSSREITLTSLYFIEKLL